MQEISDIEIPEPLKDPVTSDDLLHRQFEPEPFWEQIPAFKGVSREEFLDVKFQNSNSATKVDHLDELLEDVVSPDFLADVRKGMHIAPMNMRLSPYILSLIDWSDPYNDPLRVQFIPVGSTKKPDHPKLSLDSLSEQEDSPTGGLVHRYFDKALFLPLDVCPVYCRFCTRSYAIGSDTDQVTKLSFKAIPDKWNKAFAYIASRPEIEDIVISGGDTYMLKPHRIKQIGETLLSIPHVRRLRFATKGPAVMPMKILNQPEWTDALIDVVNQGREMSKEVVLHTHFNHWKEITSITYDAMDYLFKAGVTVRNQSVLIRGVNDKIEDMINLVRQLSIINVQPYYVYQHDMVQGTEELRTTLQHSLEVERHVRGTTAGFNTPTFVTDAPGGGGKRDIHSYDHYDEVSGISVYRSPSVDEDKLYLYFDPIYLLPKEGQDLWRDPKNHDDLVKDALSQMGR
ncbi:MAG: KamA family radical SAM protein [Candidatus Marinimicrobia bacterium]|nr:KamA family radical SAM protein [Candidatus Neomarinimicrobiota bacterium]MCF7851104.1 KamA family radical SAM protein [Candidatus Neomarinimicrobiota bacterium]MCF7904348.1 KamA family radical SAM protein [Candidatus Neomarinimicrobiota bacterium]